VDAEPESSGSSDADAEALGATIIRMPLLSDTMTEGVIAEWHKKVGDKVKSDDALADVETDKATMEVIGYADGVLLYVGVEKGQAAKVNDIIAIVGKEGTDVSALLKSGSKAALAELKAESQPDKAKPAVDSTAATETQHVESDSTSRLKASPLARKIAKDKGIDISQVKGSAEGGRIVKKDIESFKPLLTQAQSPKASTRSCSIISGSGYRNSTCSYSSSLSVRRNILRNRYLKCVKLLRSVFLKVCSLRRIST